MTSSANRVLCCTVGDFCCSLAAAQVLALRGVEDLATRPLTTASEPWIGTLRLGEEAIPVLDLARRLGLPATADPRRGQVLLLQTVHGKFGLRVDRSELAPVSDDRELVPLPTWLRSPGTAVYAGLESPVTPAELPATESDFDLFASHAAADFAVAWIDDVAPQAELPRLRIDAARLIATDLTAMAAPTIRTAAVQSQLAALVARGAEVAERFLSVALPASKLPSPARLGVPLVQVLEVLAPLPVVAVPLAVPALRGVAWWRGQPVAVLDLNAWLNRPASAQAERGRWVILRPTAGAEPLAVRVRADVRVERPPFAYAVCEPPPAIAALPLRGSFQHEHKAVVFPDWGRLQTAFSGQ